MKVERTRANVFTLTATSQELSALIAAARLALEVMESDPRAPRRRSSSSRAWSATTTPRSPAFRRRTGAWGADSPNDS